MSAPVNAPSQAPDRAEPNYFGPEERPLLGWLHRPAPGTPVRDVGLVICQAFGYEALCAHRSMRHLAAMAAATGMPALRFDYDGKGDSAGAALDPGRWPAWLASVRAAAEELRARTGVTRVCLVGMRLGAAVAAEAASTIPSCDGLVLLAPIIAGRAALRELRAIEAALGRPEAPPRFAVPQEVQEAVGFRYDWETKAAIGRIDLLALRGQPPADVLLIDRDDRPPQDELVAAWRGAGRRVEHAVLPGVVEMLLDPHDAQVPGAMMAAVRTWLERRYAAVGAVPAAAPPPPRRTARMAPGIVEEVVSFGPGGRLTGVVTRPAGPPSRALLFLNAGANHHVGHGRLYVKLARRLAERGWLVLRYDVSSIGESATPLGERENAVYSANALDDLAAAIAFARAQPGVREVEAVGLCSGAFHAFKGAVRGLALDGVVAVNPLVFFWRPEMPLAYPPYRMVSDAASLQRSMRSPRKWLKLLRGGVDVRGAIRVLGQRAADVTRHVGRDAMRALGATLADDLTAEIDALVARGVRLRFIFSVGDPGEAILLDTAGRRLASLQRKGRAHIAHLELCDHSLSKAWMHEALWERLAEELGVPQ